MGTSTSPLPPQTDMTDRPEAYVLIHGAHHGSWVWDPLLAHLRLPALAVDLPGRGARPADLRSLTLDDYALAVAADIHAAGLRRVILVGHSLAGSVACMVAARNPNAVTHLVGVAAVFPSPGHSAIDQWPAGLRWLPRTGLVLPPGGRRAPLTLSIRKARHRLANDLDDEQARWLLANLGPEAVALTTSPVPETRLAPDLARTYVLCGNDRALPAERQRRQARTIGAQIVEIGTGHDPMVSAPGILANVLNGLLPTSRSSDAPGRGSFTEGQ